MRILNKPYRIQIRSGRDDGVRFYWAQCTSDYGQLLLSDRGIFQNAYEVNGMKACVSTSVENVIRKIRENYGRVRFLIV